MTQTDSQPDQARQPGHDSRTEIFPEVRGFKISAELARTPRGIVYKARRLVENDTVALKIFRRNICDKIFIDKLARNAEASFAMQHSGLVKSLGCIADPQDPGIAGRALLITEFVQGQSVALMLKAGQPLPPSRALLAALQSANALQYAAAHKRFHGRLHPNDILIGGGNARVLGAGLGERPEHPAWAMKDPYLFEPLAYTAPEALPSQKFPDMPLERAAVDIYALGAILFHALCGRPPFIGADEGALIAERGALKTPVAWPAGIRLPQEALGIVEKMLAPAAADRPSYEALIPMLTDALFAIEKMESDTEKTEGARPPAQSESPQFAKSGATPLPPVQVPAHSGAMGGVRPVSEGWAGANSAANSTSPKLAPEAPIRSATPHGTFPALKRSARNNATPPWVLASVAVLAFLAALVLLLAYWLPTRVAIAPPETQASPQPASNSANPPTQAPLVAPIAPATPSNTAYMPSTPPISAPARAELPARDSRQLAAKQFELIEDMLKKGQIGYSPALLKMVKGIAGNAGRDTPAGLRAMLLASEIEDFLASTAAGNPAGVLRPRPATDSAQGDKEEADPLAQRKLEEQQAAERKAAQEAARKAEELAAKNAALAELLNSVKERAAKFQYEDALSELEKTRLEGASKKLADAQIDLVKQEQAFFKRCRQRLLDEIARNPRKESPLQVYPRKNDPVGDDIVDFDGTGLTIQVKRPRLEKKVTEWSRVPPAQALILLQLLSDKTSVEDQSGMAVFAFHRNLDGQSGAALEALRGLNGGGEKAAALEDLFKALKAAGNVQ